MRTKPITALLVVTAVAVGCSTTQTGAGPASPTTRDLSKVPVASPPASVSTVTVAPRPTIANTPECVAYGKFNVAQSAMSFATAEQLAQITATYERVTDDAIAALPQFATELGEIKELTLKEANGELSDDEKSQLRTAFEPITTWNTETCVEDAD